MPRICPFLIRDRFTGVVPILSASSFEEIFRSAADLVEANNYGHGVSLRNLVGVEVQLSGVQEELGKHEQDDAENQRGPIE